MEPRDCIICCEHLELFGVGQCGHNSICARCHYKMRAKQQNLHCGYCKELNQHMLITDSIEARMPEDPDVLIEYKEGAIYFPSILIKRMFEELMTNKCPFCNMKFDDVNLYKKHLREKHWQYLWY